jgi:hypothetical protein
MMEALARGIPGGRVTFGGPPSGAEPFAVWGQEWLALRVIPRAVREGRPFWNLHNGFCWPARGG